MVIVKTSQKTKERLLGVTEFTVLESSHGLIVHGNIESIVSKVQEISDETKEKVEMVVYDSGNKYDVVYNDHAEHEPVSQTSDAENAEVIASEPAVEEVPEEVDDSADPDPTEEPAYTGSIEAVAPETVCKVASEEAEVASEEKAEEPDENAGTAVSDKAASDSDGIKFEGSKARKIPPLLPVPETVFTAEDAINKLEKDKKRLESVHVLNDVGAEESASNTSDALYVLNQLIERCGKDSNLCQYIMREGKTFIGAYKYLATLARESYVGMTVSGIGCTMVDLSREASIPYFIEYFMLNDDEIDRLKKEEEEKKKAERAAAKAAKTRKKSEKGNGRLAGRIEKKEDPGLLAGIKIPEAPKAEVSKPAPAPVKPVSPVAKKTPAQSNEQLDMFAMMGMAV